MDIRMTGLGKTWVLDLDGTLVRHNGYLSGGDEWLDGALEFLQSLPEEDMVLLVTSRKEEEAGRQTEAFLKESGVRYAHIVYGAPYGERILVNDSKPSGRVMAYAQAKERDGRWDLRVERDPEL